MWGGTPCGRGGGGGGGGGGGPRGHEEGKGAARADRLGRSAPLGGMRRRRPPMRSIEDDRYQFWWREAEALLVEIEG